MISTAMQTILFMWTSLSVVGSCWTSGFHGLYHHPGPQTIPGETRKFSVNNQGRSPDHKPAGDGGAQSTTTIHETTRDATNKALRVDSCDFVDRFLSQPTYYTASVRSQIGIRQLAIGNLFSITAYRILQCS